MIDCVVFDLDGTLLRSNELKRHGFFVVASNYPGGAVAMEEILRVCPGDRSAILSQFSRVFSADAASLVRDYSSWCESQLLYCEEREGASELLTFLGEMEVPIYLNSATPTDQLRTFVEKRYAPQVFKGVFGGHGEKENNLRLILSNEAIGPEKLLMIGDGIDDLGAATAVGCAFVGVDEGTLAARVGHMGLVNNLEDIKHMWRPTNAFA